MTHPWAVAAVAIACIGGIVGLAAVHADTTAMLGVLLTVIGGLSISIHQQTNGNTSKLIELVSRQSQQLARTMPPLTETPQAPEESGGSTT
jgi:hypothetical protein